MLSVHVQNFMVFIFLCLKLWVNEIWRGSLESFSETPPRGQYELANVAHTMCAKQGMRCVEVGSYNAHMVRPLETEWLVPLVYRRIGHGQAK